MSQQVLIYLPVREEGLGGAVDFHGATGVADRLSAALADLGLGSLLRDSNAEGFARMAAVGADVDRVVDTVVSLVKASWSRRGAFLLRPPDGAVKRWERVDIL